MMFSSVIKKQNSTIEYERDKNWRASIDYNYSPGLKGWSPFANIQYDAKWFSIVKDTKINFLPQSFSFNTGLQRNYHELQERDLEGSEGIPVTFSQQFYWSRDLSIRWDPLQLLRMSFNARTKAEVEEPYTVVNKDLYPDEYQLWKDSVKMSLLNMGRPLDYSQSFLYPVGMLIYFADVDASIEALEVYPEVALEDVVVGSVIAVTDLDAVSA